MKFISKSLSLMGITAVALLSSCGDESPFGYVGTEGKGFILPIVEINTKTLTSRSSVTRADDESEGKEITVNDLSIRLTKKDGSATWTWPINEFPTDKEFSVGSYTLEAFYGDASNEGFNLPAYYGKQDIEVNDGKTTNISLTATLANSLITVRFADSFKDYMSDWNAKVNNVEYAKDEDRPVYVNPGEIDIKIGITKPNGLSAEFALDKITTLPRYHYVVSVDINNGNVGEANLIVTFDEAMAEDDVYIDISDEVLLAPLPMVDIDGFNDNEPVDVIAGLDESTPLSMSLIAQAGIKDVFLKTSSTSLISKGWPEEINLIEADALMQAKLTAFGLEVLGLWKSVGDMAYIDFSRVVSNIDFKTDEENISTFTVIVKDKLMRESKPSVLSLKVEEMKLILTTPMDSYNPGNDLDLILGFNGSLENIKNNVSLQYYNSRGTWSNIEIKDVEKLSEESYKIVITTPDLDDDLRLRAKCLNKYSDELIVGLAPFEIQVSDLNVFAQYAYLKVVGVNGNPDPDLSNAKFTIKKKNDNSYVAITTSPDEGYIKLSGLEPGIDYQVKVAIGDKISKASTFKTEIAADVPNGDFENLFDPATYSVTINQGGQWRYGNSSLYDYKQNEVSYEISEAINWSTNNYITMSGLTLTGDKRNTWYVQPSVFNTSLSYNSIAKKPGNITGSQRTGKPSSFDYKSKDGNGMVIRNVGWSTEGIEISKQTNSGQFNSNKPDMNIINKSIGKMYLKDSNHQNEGYTFSSRPTCLKGWYNYIPLDDQEDQGKITVEVYSGNEKIASGEKLLVKEENDFNIPLTYLKDSPKATEIRIKIYSSNLEESEIDLKAYTSMFEAYYHGATLVVDDFQFEY